MSTSFGCASLLSTEYIYILKPENFHTSKVSRNRKTLNIEKVWKRENNKIFFGEKTKVLQFLESNQTLGLKAKNRKITKWFVLQKLCNSRKCLETGKQQNPL